MRTRYIQKEGKMYAYSDYVEKFGKPQQRVASNNSNIIVKKSFDAYESPSSGEVVSSYAQRKEDLARTDCVEYDPEMKTDQMNNVKADDAKIDSLVDETVEREFAMMPGHKKEKLVNEMASTELEYTRN